SSRSGIPRGDDRTPTRSRTHEATAESPTSVAHPRVTRDGRVRSGAMSSNLPHAGRHELVDLHRNHARILPLIGHDVPHVGEVRCELCVTLVHRRPEARSSRACELTRDHDIERGPEGKKMNCRIAPESAAEVFEVRGSKEDVVEDDPRRAHRNVRKHKGTR